MMGDSSAQNPMLVSMAESLKIVNKQIADITEVIEVLSAGGRDTTELRTKIAELNMRKARWEIALQEKGYSTEV